MVLPNQKIIGYVLAGFAGILLLVLAFVKVNLDKEGAFLCEAVAENPNLDMAQCPAHNTNTSWLLTIAFSIGAILLGSGLYLVFVPPKKGLPKAEFKAVDLSKLDEEEKKIYDLLKQNNGSLYQSDLIRETGFSKVKITRILDKMASKELIGRERRGMTNIVVLK